MTTPDMTAILEELAGGRIDAAEASRRIDALKAAETTSASAAQSEPSVTAEPTNEELAAEREVDSDPWAAETDRPQHATYHTESFGKSEPKPAPQEPAAEEPVRTPVNTNGVERVSVRAIGRRVRIVGETCGAMDRYSKSPAMASLEHPSMGSAFFARHAAWTTSGRWVWARSSSCASIPTSRSTSRSPLAA
jgi:hypothetical protein